MTRPLPSGTQYPISHGGHEAVVAEVGATLRSYAVDGRDAVVSFAEDRIAPASSGATLAPWPNRLRDGNFVWDGEEHQVDITEPDRMTALHGLVGRVRFELVSRTDSQVTLAHRIVPTQGYPWPVTIEVTYALGEDGLTVTTRASNPGAAAAPYGLGTHPWLSPGPGPVDACTLTLDAARHVTVDDRLLPTGTEPVKGTYDLRDGLPLAGVSLDDAWVEPVRDAAGRSWAELAGPDGRTVVMWGDETFAAWQVCTGDAIPGIDRAGVAVEPMTCIADAFRTGDLLIRLEPGAVHEARWGLTVR